MLNGICFYSVVIMKLTTWLSAKYRVDEFFSSAIQRFWFRHTEWP